MAQACPLVTKALQYEINCKYCNIGFSMFFQEENVAYLNVEQALADHATLIDHIRVNNLTSNMFVFITNLCPSQQPLVQTQAQS